MMTIREILDALTWSWLKTPSVLRETWCRARLGIPFSTELLTEDGGAVNLDALAEKMSSVFGSGDSAVRDWYQHAERNDVAWALKCLAPHTARRAYTSSSRPNEAVGPTVEIEALYNVSGSCRYSASETRTYSIEVPFEVIQEAVEAEDSSIIEDWIDDNFGDGDTIDQEEDGYDYEDYDESCSDLSEVTTSTSALAEELYDRYYDEFTPEPEEGEE